MVSTTRRRVARKRRWCYSDYMHAGRSILPGDVYLEHTSFPGPGDEEGYATEAGHPIRIAECAECAIRYGRDELVTS